MHLGFGAHHFVGCGNHGQIVLTEKAKKKLHKYQIQPGSAYVEMWQEDLPGNIRSDSRKAVSSSGVVFLKNDEIRAPTLTLSSDGSQVLDTWRHEGELLGCLPSGQPAYVLRNGADYELVIKENGDSERRLQPALGHAWWDLLSMCGDERGRTVVTDFNNRTLTIFSSDMPGELKINPLVGKKCREIV